MTDSIWCRYSVSDSIIPARKAPVAIDTPAACDTHAAPSATINTASVNSSRNRLCAISYNNGRNKNRPAKTTAATASAPTPTEAAMRVGENCKSPAVSAPASTKNGTKARSWNNNTPKAMRPWVRLISDCSVSCCRMIAVELIAIAPPIAIAGKGAVPSNQAMPATAVAVSTTCAVPMPNTSLRIATMRGQENSSPNVNSRNTTPSSDSNCVVSVLRTAPNA